MYLQFLKNKWILLTIIHLFFYVKNDKKFKILLTCNINKLYNSHMITIIDDIR